MEEKAARAYDLAALKYWGPSTHINFSVYFISCNNFMFGRFESCVSQSYSFCLLWQIENYQVELEEMKNMSRQEYVAHLRRYTYRVINN